MSPLRVLHVDDEPDIREVAELALRLDPEITVHGCGSGRDAIQAAASWGPDLILLDVMMPVMDGPATLNHLRQSPATSAIPVVFMTARAQPRELEHFVSLGAEGVIPKPFDPMTLAASVRNYAGSSQFNIAERRANFVKRARRNAETLVQLRTVLGPPTPPDVLTQLRAIAHSIAGGAGVFGLPRIGAQASTLECAVIDRIEGRAGDVEKQLDGLLASIAATNH